MNHRSLAALALLASLALPALASAQSQPQPRGSARRDGPSLRVGGLIGLDQGDLDGLGLRGDVEADLQRLAPHAFLSGVGSLGFSRVSESGGGVEVTANVLSIVPAARFRMDLTPQVGVYGDLGLGVYYANVDTDVDLGPSGDDSDVGLMMRFGAGGYLWAGETVRFSAELAFSPHFGDYDDTTFTLLVGAMVPVW